MRNFLFSVMHDWPQQSVKLVLYGHNDRFKKKKKSGNNKTCKYET